MGTVFRQKGRSTWMLKYYRDGGPIYESSGTDIKDDARGILKLREADIVKGFAVTRSGRLRFDAAVKDVENDYTTNQRKSLDDLEARIRLHLIPAFGGRRMNTITTADIQSYVVDRLAAGAKPASVNRELAIIKRAFTLAVHGGTLVAKPHIPMLEEHNVRTGFFEREQFDAVRKHLPSDLREPMTFAFLTGWRVPSEVLPLTWAQIDEQSQIVRLEVGSTKNSDGRTFPYGVLPELVAVVEAQARRRDDFRARGVICPWVFQRDDGRPIKRFSEEWRAACVRAGAPGRIPHDFRRTAVRNLVRAGVSEKVAMQLTGHKTRSVFDRYDIVNEADLRTAVSKLAGQPAATRARKRPR
jgi:integrase